MYTYAHLSDRYLSTDIYSLDYTVSRRLATVSTRTTTHTDSKTRMTWNAHPRMNNATLGDPT
jgi:hypothetical protein